MEMNDWIDIKKLGPMNGFKIEVKMLNEYGRLNLPSHVGDAGCDVYATKTVKLKPRERYNMPLGLALKFPPFLVCLVMDKSGIAKKTGLHSIGGVIDTSYRGEIHAQMVNSSNEDVLIKNGEKIAQLVFVPFFVPADIKLVTKFDDETTRGEAGFGSTGIQ